MRRNFFIVLVAKHWHRLPREVWESPSLEILGNCLDQSYAMGSRRTLFE